MLMLSGRQIAIWVTAIIVFALLNNVFLDLVGIERGPSGGYVRGTLITSGRGAAFSVLFVIECFALWLVLNRKR